MRGFHSNYIPCGANGKLFRQRAGDKGEVMSTPFIQFNRRATHPTRWVLSIVAAAMLMLVTIAVPATSAGAHDSGAPATPANDSYHPWATNGCTAVPDSGYTFNFNHACDHHDGCYGNHWWTPYGRSRYGCDRVMNDDMTASCRQQFNSWDWRRYSCYTVRTTYYLGVRTFGYPAYAGWSINSLLGL